MELNNPKVKRVLLQLGLLCISLFLWAYIVWSGGYLITSFLLFTLVFLQVRNLLLHITKTERALENFLKRISNDDIETLYPEEKDEDLAQIHKEFNRIIKVIRNSRKEKEAEYQYFKNIVHHVGIGIITFDRKGYIQLFNIAAKKLLNTYQVKNLKEIEPVSYELVQAFRELKTGGRQLIKVQVGDEARQLAIYAIELSLKNEEFKLISIQNIQSELDEKEMEAWENLVRVLTHEIMNSVTPISSLAGTTNIAIDGLIEESTGDVCEVKKEDMADLQLSLNTIEKRSEGLIRFLNEFRSLTHTPTPQLNEENLNVLLDEICLLMQKDFAEKGVTLHKEYDENLPTIFIDRELIEQVIINLLKNASEAFDDEQEVKPIYVSTFLDDKKRLNVSIRDEGTGIEEEALKKIFIPFFTTKNKGSGIGLSLSREIMRKHNGNITVKSTLDFGTEFVLKF